MTAPATAPVADFTDTDKQAIIRNIRFLAGVDDGAIARDHQGFDGGDTKRGQYLARLDSYRWHDYQIYWARERVQKYRGQLERAGLPTDMAWPPKAAYPTWEERRGVVTQSNPPAFRRTIARTATGFEVRFTYDQDLVADIRTVPGRQYKNGVNYIPLESELALREFALQHGFVWESF